MEKLKKLLHIKEGKLKNDVAVITLTTIKDFDDDGRVAALIKNSYADKQIEVRQATVEVDDEVGMITIEGKSDLFASKDLKTELHILYRQGETFELIVKYKLPRNWKFEKTFPNLPKVFDIDNLKEKGASVFENYDVKEGEFIFSSFEFSQNDIVLKPGLNIAIKKNKTKLSGTAGILSVLANELYSKYLPQEKIEEEEKSKDKSKSKLEDKITDATYTVMFGTINPNYSEKPVAKLKDGAQPWDLDEIPVGILLTTRGQEESSILGGRLHYTLGGDKVYSPIDSVWYYDNPEYKPMSGRPIMVKLSSKSDKNFKANVLMPGGSSTAEVASSSKLEIKDIAQWSEFFTKSVFESEGLPDFLKTAISKGENLQISSFSACIDYGKKKRVQHLTCTVAYKDVKKGASNSFFRLKEVEVLIALLRKKNELTPELKITVSAEMNDLPVKLTATKKNKYKNEVALAGPYEAPIHKFLPKISGKDSSGKEIEKLYTMQIKTLAGEFESYEKYKLSFGLGKAAEPWIIPLGGLPIVFGETSIVIEKESASKTIVKVTAEAVIGDAKLSASYEYPGKFEIKGVAAELSMAKIINGLTKDNSPLPANFDIKFRDTVVAITKDKEEYLLQLSSEIEQGISFGVAAQYFNSNWGVIGGISISTAKLAGVEVMKPISDFLGGMGIDTLVFVASSADIVNFRPSAHNPLHRIIQSDGKISQGFFLKTELDFDKNDVLRKIKDLLNVEKGKLEIGYYKSRNEFVGSLGVAGYLKSGLKKSEIQKLSNYEKEAFVGEIQVGFGTNVSFGLSGTHMRKIEGNDVEFNMTMSVLPTGVMLSGSMVNSKKPLTIGDFQLENLALSIGTNSAGVPSVGLAGLLIVKNLAQINVAVMFDSNNAMNCMLVGSISDLKFTDILKSIVEGDKKDKNVLPNDVLKLFDDVKITGPQAGHIHLENAAHLVTELNERNVAKIANAVNEKSNNANPFPEKQDQMTIYNGGDNIWYITTTADKTRERTPTRYQLRYDNNSKGMYVSRQAQIYVVPNPMGVKIGNLPEFKCGVLIAGRLKVMGIDIELDGELIKGKGVRFYGNMEPLTIGHKQLLSVSGIHENTPAKVYFTSFDDNHAIRNEWKMKTFYIDASVTFLLRTAQAKISVNDKGASFEMSVNFAEILTGTIKGKFSNYNDAFISGTLQAKLGTYNIPVINHTLSFDTGISVTVKAEVTPSLNKVPNMSLIFTPKVEVLGKHVDVPAFSIDVEGDKIEKLADEVKDQIMRHLRNYFDVKNIADLAQNGYKFASDGYDHIKNKANQLFNNAVKESGKWADVAREDIMKAFFACSDGAAHIDAAVAEAVKLQSLQNAYKEAFRVANNIDIELAVKDGVVTLTSWAGKAVTDTTKFVGGVLQDIGDTAVKGKDSAKQYFNFVAPDCFKWP